MNAVPLATVSLKLLSFRALVAMFILLLLGESQLCAKGFARRQIRYMSQADCIRASPDALFTVRDRSEPVPFKVVMLYQSPFRKPGQ